MTTASLPRITARVDSDTQALLSQAAAIMGMTSLNAFVLNAAIEKAKAVLLQEQALMLSVQDAQTLIHALDAPPKANERLKAAALSSSNSRLNCTFSGR
jgi:uncharacterized protein (DUF1778 family)